MNIQVTSNMESVSGFENNNEIPCVKALFDKTVKSANAVKQTGENAEEMKILPRLGHKKRVLLIGDVVLDKYISGMCTRLAGESPNPVFEEKNVQYSLGGAGNVARNLVAMGISTDLLAVVGEIDTKVTELLQNENINTENLVRCPNYRIRVAKRFLQGQHHLFRTDKNARQPVDPDIKHVVKERLSELLLTYQYEMIIISEYRNELLTTELVQHIICMSTDRKIPVLVDPKIGDYSRFAGASYLKPNLQDATYFCGIDVKTEEDILNACKKFSDDLKIPTIILTLSEKGIAYFERKGNENNDFRFGISPTCPNTKVTGVCGAGDTVIAAVAFSVTHGFSIVQACFFANRCAESVVRRSGTVSVNMLDVIPDKIIYTREELRTLRSLIPADTTVAVTTGCFDMLHLGHITALALAKEQADLLIVALNSDSSVRRNKGESRPVIPLKQRAATLAYIDSVDFIVVFEEEVPHWIMEIIQPDVLVKGSDYTLQRLKEIYPYINKFFLTPPIDINSTTEIIKRIKELTEHNLEKAELDPGQLP